MSRRKEPNTPYLDIQDALSVAAVINRFAASFDVKEELSVPDARVLFVLSLRVMSALVRAFPQELKDLMARAEKENDEPEPDDSN